MALIKGLILIGILLASFVLAVTLSIVYDPVWMVVYFGLIGAWILGKVL